jgi:hypothetical protein
MKKIAILPLAAFAVAAACADFQGAIAPDELNIKAASPGTEVTGSFKVVGEGGTTVTPRTSPRGAAGTCYTNADGIGVWVHNGNEQVGHNQCNDSDPTEGATINVTFDVVANYVQPRSGNIQLNFTSCGYVEDEEGNWIEDCDADKFVHYNHRHDQRVASGALKGHGDDGSEWIIHLGQTADEGVGGLHPGVREFTGLLAQKVGSNATWEAASFSW